MWFNNFVEFERKQNRPNRLVLGFHSPELRRSVKGFAEVPVSIPTNFLTKEAKDKLLLKIANVPELSRFPLSEKQLGDFYVLTIQVPYDNRIIHLLDRKFQTGNYDKIIRFRGFYPESKFVVTDGIEKILLKGDEVKIRNLRKENFGDFLTAEQLSNLPSIDIDIEKPLWRTEEEKELLKRREKLLRQERKYEKKKIHTADEEQEHSRKIEEISELEQKLTININDVGEVRLFEDRFDAAISFIATRWKLRGREIKELYVIDPNNEIKDEKVNGYNVLFYKSEESLVRGLLDNMHRRKPIVCRGHYESYDVSQLTYAADDLGFVFDPAVKGVKPRRDFVRFSVQRLREEMIYFDSHGIFGTFFPHLRQRSLGTNLKLETLARFIGINFEKSLSHEELRRVELRRLAGKTRKIRSEAAKQLINYATSDLDVTTKIFDSIDFMPLYVRLKRVVPYCTLTEIAFSHNCMNKWHEFRHFNRTGNLPYYGFRQKERRDQIMIFRSRFSKLKRELISGFGIERIEGNHRDIDEYYFSLEEALKEVAFQLSPALRQVYQETKEYATANGKRGEEQFFALLQYMKAFMRDVYLDYDLFRADKDAYNSVKIAVTKPQTLWQVPDKDLERGFSELEKKVDRESLSLLFRSFKDLKAQFTKVFADLNGKQRSLIKPSSERLRELRAKNIHVPEVMMHDIELYLLRESAEEIRKGLEKSKRNVGIKKDLTIFLSRFNRFEEAVGEICFRDGNILLAYCYLNKYNDQSGRFYAKYGLPAEEVGDKIRNAYRDLTDRLSGNARVVNVEGDYIFVANNAGDGKRNLDIPHLYHVRNIDSYDVN